MPWLIMLLSQRLGSCWRERKPNQGQTACQAPSFLESLLENAIPLLYLKKKLKYKIGIKSAQILKV